MYARIFSPSQGSYYSHLWLLFEMNPFMRFLRLPLSGIYHAFQDRTPPFQEFYEQNSRRYWVIMIEVAIFDADSFLQLVDHAKQSKLFERAWGKWAHPTMLVDYNSPRSIIIELVEFFEWHTNDMCSMSPGELRGIVNINHIAWIQGNDEPKIDISLCTRHFTST